jgi:hypothetical protein
MILSLPSLSRRHTQARPVAHCKRCRFRPMAVCALVVMLGLAGTGSVVRADAPFLVDSVSIYLYNASGPPTDVTATYSYHDNHLFDPEGYMVGTGGSNGQILDASSQVIGYVTPADAPTL